MLKVINPTGKGNTNNQCPGHTTDSKISTRSNHIVVKNYICVRGVLVFLFYYTIDWRHTHIYIYIHNQRPGHCISCRKYYILLDLSQFMPVFNHGPVYFIYSRVLPTFVCICFTLTFMEFSEWVRSYDISFKLAYLFIHSVNTMSV